MNVSSVALLLLSSFFGLAHGHAHCGTKSLGKKKLDVVQKEIESVKRKRHAIICKQCITIDTYVYAFRKADGEGDFLNAANMDIQMQIINAAFADTPFQFKLIQADFVVDDYYYEQYYSPAELALGDDKEPLALTTKYPRRGDYKTLNMYFGGDDNADSGGFAYFPEAGELVSNPYDGVYNAAYSAPGSADDGEGKTAIHEIGHWLGLEHVFNSVNEVKECDPNDPNDYVDDTPAMKNFKAGTDGECPPDTTDTCPDLDGVDPIHNFMDYSSDPCQTEFTRGQVERMYYVWSLYRSTGDACSSGHQLLEIEVKTDDFGYEISWLLKSTDGKFVWSSQETDQGISSEYGNDELTIRDICIDPAKDYVFTISDTEGDGLQGEEKVGYYEIRYGGKVIKRSEGNFGAQEITSITSGGAPDTPAPAVPPTSAPIAVVTPSPIVPETPAPVVPETPAPVVPETPAPVVPETPAPIVPETPAPIVPDTPAPIVPETPAPIVPETPAPVVPETPAPIVPETPAPVAPETPAPVVPETPAPVTPAPVTPAPVTPAPVIPETSSPTPAVGICFSGSSVVQIRNKGAVPMSKLEIGDWVKTGSDKFEPVYSFGHRNHDQKAVFLQIHASNSNILEISQDHMVFASKIRKFVPASNLRKGDLLLDGTGQLMAVESIRKITAIGVYAPFTPSGKIVVNDIVASSFVAMERKDSLLGFSFQWMAHTFEFPHRVACHYLASCPTETYTEEGVSTWVALPFQISRSVLEQQESLFKTMMLGVVITLLLVFYTLEQIIFVPYVMLTTLSVGGFTVALRKIASNKKYV